MKKHLVPLLLVVVALWLVSMPLTVVAQLRTMAFQMVTISDTTANALVVGGVPGATSGTGGVKAGPIVSSSSITDSVGSMATIRAGGIGIASQGSGDVPYATSSTQFGRVNGTGLLKMNGSSAPTVVATTAVGALTLLCEATGTSTAVGATNVATCAMAGGLTAKDTLYVVVRASSSGAAVASLLYNVTDSVTIRAGSSTNAASNDQYWSVMDPASSVGVATAALSTGTSAFTRCTFSTAFTGSWTLALQHSGVASGTWTYQWTVYKIAGQ